MSDLAWALLYNIDLLSIVKKTLISIYINKHALFDFYFKITTSFKENLCHHSYRNCDIVIT